MKKLFAVLVVALLFSPEVSAQTIQDIPPGEDVIESLSRGQQAPFTGQLFDINTALRWANWLRQYKAQIEAVEKRERSLCQSELSYERDINELEVGELQTLNADLKTRLLRSETKKSQAEYDRDHPPWYSSVWFGVVIGVVGTSGLAYAGSQLF